MDKYLYSMVRSAPLGVMYLDNMQLSADDISYLNNLEVFVQASHDATNSFTVGIYALRHKFMR